MTIGKYAGRLFVASLHWPLLVLELVEIIILVALHPLEINFPDWKEAVDVMYVVFAGLLVLTFFIGLLIAGYHLHSKEEKAKNHLEEKLRPALQVCGAIPRSAGSHLRIGVHNRSAMTVRFSVKITSIEPPLPRYDKIPNFLQIDDSDPPHREAHLEGGGYALVNVLAWIGDDQDKAHRLYGLLVASPLVMDNPSAGAISLPRDHYRIRVQAFPVSPEGPASVPRDFYIIPQANGMLLLSDAGVPHHAG
jgi:hypothetical protein